MTTARNTNEDQTPTGGEDSRLTKRQAAAASKSRLKRITKTRRHSVRTNNRVIKYGAKSFMRNAWLSLAAIAIMTITLIILAATVVATDVLGTAIKTVENQVDYSIYIKQSATDEQVATIKSRMEALESVTEVTTTSPEQANNKAIRKMVEDNHIKDQSVIQSLYQAPNKMQWIFNVKLKQIDDTRELEQFVENDESMRGMLDAKEPTYKTENRGTVDNIAKIMDRIRMVGLIAAGIFAAIAILVVFNTIRMSIFNRKEEIYMMRLVGASRWFIVGPFVIESMLYGVVSAIISTCVIYGGSFALRSSIGETLMSPTLDKMEHIWYLFAAALLVVGIIIGIVSSLLATRKYVKVK